MKGQAMFRMIKAFAKDEEGATAIEYGLIAALVAVAAISALDALGSSLIGTFDFVSTSINGVLGN